MQYDMDWERDHPEPPCPNVEWIHEDELPEDYPYDDMFPFSIIPGGVGCRVFPKVGK